MNMDFATAVGLVASSASVGILVGWFMRAVRKPTCPGRNIVQIRFGGVPIADVVVLCGGPIQFVDVESGKVVQNTAEKTAVQRDREELERFQVQLAGCLAAAEGATKNPAREGDYGWSPAYERVLKLRLEVDALRTELGR